MRQLLRRRPFFWRLGAAFRDGVAQPTQTWPAGITGSQAIVLGNNWTRSVGFIGRISEALVLNSALSTSDRQLLERNAGAYHSITVA